MITAWEGLGYTNNYNLPRNTYVKGSRHYELSNHTSTLLSAGLGNVLTVVSDRKIEHDERYAFAVGGGYKYENGAYHLDAAGSFAQLSASDGIISHYTAEQISDTDYYAFGAPLPGRTYNASEYRFGYNKGSEKDDEIYGEGNSYTTYFREIDVRIVRLWGTDPSVKAWESPFVLNHNSPLLFVDPFGDDPPKRLSLWSRVDNVMKGDSYKNKANKYAVENKVDEARISTGNGKVKIDESYYKNYQSGSEKGLLTGGTTLIEKSVVFNDSDPEEGNKYDWAGNSPVKSAGFGNEFGLSAQMAGGFVKGEFKNQTEQLSNSETGLGNWYNRGIITLSHTILGGNSEIFENKASRSNYTYLMVDFKSRAMPSNANYKYVMEVVNVLQISAFKMEWNETTEQLKVGLEWGNPKRIELSKNVEHNIQLYEQFNK